MKTYFVLFGIPATAIQDWVATVSEDERKKQTETLMKAWKTWMTTHAAVLTNTGSSLGKTKRVTAQGTQDTKNDLNWYLTVQAHSHAAAAELFENHPHLQIPTSYIEVMSTSGPEK